MILPQKRNGKYGMEVLANAIAVIILSIQIYQINIS